MWRTNYWCWIEPDALTQIPAMSQTTAFVLRLAADYLKPIMSPDTLRVLAPYFGHAEKVLAGTDLGSWTERAALIAAGPSLEAPDLSADVQEAVYEALMTNRKVEVRYRAKHESASKRIVLNPLGIVVRAGIVYLVATSWRYDDIWHYVLHRMSEPRLIEEALVRPGDFRRAEHLGENGAFAYPAGPGTLALQALFDAGAGAHLSECRLSADQSVKEQPDGRVQVEATVPDTAQLRWWLAGFGSQVEVLEPESLRAEFREEARRLPKSTHRRLVTKPPPQH